MRKFLSKLVKPLGYDVIRTRNNHNEQNALAAAFALTKPDLVIDVGANNGQFYRLCRNAGYTGALWCLEPSPVEFQNLSSLLQNDDHARAFNLGVGAKRDKLTLNVSGKIGDMSSFLEQNDLYKERFKSGKTREQVEVEIVTLEHLIATELPDFTGTIFVKTDTQGMDKHVLDGLGKYLDGDMVRGIKSEMSVQNIYVDAASHWDILDVLAKLEMQPLYFEHISRNEDYRLIEYDIIAVK